METKDPNVKHDQMGETLLTIASSNGHIDIVKLLLKMKADVNVPSKTGLTAIIGATMG